MVFYLTLAASFLGISFEGHGWHRDVIVSFLTPREIKGLFDGTSRPVKVLSFDRHPLEVRPLMRLTILMSRIGRALLVAKEEGGG